MSVTVTLDIYSGLPNPSWELSDEQAAQFVEQLRSARSTTLEKPGALDGRLGYRGFFVRSVQEKGLEPLTLVHAGLADIDRFAPSLVLPGSDVEQWLLSTGADALPEGLAAFVGEQIERGHGVSPLSDTLAAPLVEPPYDPGKWNNDPTIQRSNNCYNYANDKITNTFAQPGRGTGQEGPYPPDCGGTGAAAQRDGLIPLANPDLTPAEGQIVALVVANAPGFKDYHWYRRDNNQMWSHKPGQTAARNTDQSGRPISNPQMCDRGPYANFCGWYHAIPSRTRIR